jgi:hypothetical protein
MLRRYFVSAFIPVKVLQGKLRAGSSNKTLRNLFDFQFLDDNFARFYDFEKKLGKILLCFTLFAFIIAVLGLFGLASFTAEQCT